MWQELGLPGRTSVHLRAVHYMLVSRGDVGRPDGRPYQNTEQCWKWLADASAPARYLGLVDAESFIDRKNPPPRLHGGRAGRVPGGRPDVVGRGAGRGLALPSIETEPAWGLDFDLPGPTVDGYGYGPPISPTCWSAGWRSPP